MNNTKNFTEARSIFREKFYQTALQEDIHPREDLEDALPAFLPVMLRLYDSKFSRLLTVEQSREAEHGFAYVLREMDSGAEQNDLLLRYHKPQDNIPEIIALYTMWLVDRIPAADMEAILQVCARAHAVRNWQEAEEHQALPTAEAIACNV